MINIEPMNPSKTGDILGREHYPDDQPFQPGLKPTFGIKLEELDDPKGAAGVLFHEVSHLKDDELAQKWVEQYQKTGHIFVSTPEGLPAFQKWMNEQVGKRLPTQTSTPPLAKADAEIVLDKAYNARCDFGSARLRPCRHRGGAGRQRRRSHQSAKDLCHRVEGRTCGNPGDRLRS